MKRIDASLVAQASSQHGLLLRSQLAAADLTSEAVAGLIRGGFLERLSTRVLRISGSPPTREQRWLAAVLDAGPGAALAHLSAAVLWDLHRRNPARPHVIRPRGTESHRQTPHLGVVHTSRRLRADHLVVVTGIPVSTPARTIVDLAYDQPLGRVARTLDNALGRRQLTIGELSQVVADVRTRGRRGVTTLDHLVRQRRGKRPTESALERRFEEILERFRLPRMERQVDVGDENGWVARVDFARLDDRLLGFVDSDRYHRALLDRAHDESQTVRLRAAGFRVFRVSDEAILYDPSSVVRSVRAAA